MPEPELWAIAEVAEYLGIQKGAARGQLSRWGVKAVGYELGDSGRPEARFAAPAVRAANENRPKRGARTDLAAKQVHHRDGNPRNNDPGNLEPHDTPTD